VKILVAGGGAFGKEHLATLVAMGGVTLAVAETRGEELARLVAMFALADHDADAMALLDRFQPDGVVVATPPVAHAPVAARALEQGIPVLVEKPVAPDSDTMRRLCEAASASPAFPQPATFHASPRVPDHCPHCRHNKFVLSFVALAPLVAFVLPRLVLYRLIAKDLAAVFLK